MQKGGSQYGVPPSELPPFGAAGTASTSRPADATSPVPARQPNFEEMAAGAGFHEDDLLGGGEDADRGGVSGNRWPRQETLALLKIRSDMDATFREASLKGPLWEEVSRKLAEQGYTRNAKKCKEKFENVHKYYKRTKDSRAARPDGKSYRFFSQLEALHSASSSSPAAAAPAAVTAAAPAAAMPVLGGAKIQQPTPISSIPPPQNQNAVPPVAAVEPGVAVAAAAGLSGFGGGGVSFSSNSSESETEDEESEEGAREQRKRKREDGGVARGGGGSRSMMAFFDELMKQVMERQEAMQKKFLETIEKREQDRMIREEAWRRQEMARLSREQEAVTHERTVAASRDATIISFLQKITGQTVQLPQSVPPPVATQTQQPAAPVAPAAPPPPPPPAPTLPPPQLQPQPHVHPLQPAPPQVHHQTLQPPPAEIVPSAMHEHSQQIHEADAHPGSTSDPASSRWPKTEVHALINIRAGMESRYQEAGPKGPLWEEISAAMKQIGYNRNAKRCKEKWENINKYFKKVKESNKKRPDDAKTCPYFHQLDALYRSKVLGGFVTTGGDHVQARMQQQDPDPTVLPITTLPPPSNGDNSTSKTILSPIGGATQAAPNSNGGLSALRFTADTATTDMPMKKPEDIVKELMDRRQQHQQYDYDRMDDDTDDDDDEDDDDMMDEEEQKMAYKIEFQRPTMPPTSTSNANGNKSSRSAGSFLAMVHQ